MPLGLFGEPGATGDRVALRRSTRLALGAGRPDRGPLAVRGPWVHAAAWRDRAAQLPPPLRDAVLAGAEGTTERDISGVPSRDRCQDRRAGQRVARLQGDP